MPYIRACNRCYKVKAKCIFDDEARVCRRCKKLKVSCEIARPQSRLGRKPAVRSLGPECTVQVWQTEPQGSRSEASKPKKQSPTIESEDAGCKVPVPQPDQNPPAVLEDHDDDLDESTYLLEDDQPSDAATELLQATLVDLDRFYEANQRWLIGPSFARDFHAALRSVYYAAPKLLQHAFLAVLGAINRVRPGISQEIDPVDLARGAFALRQLRTASIRGVKDAEVVIQLGQTVAAIDICATGTNAFMILRHSLAITKPWYPELAKEERLDCITVTPILMDTVECLMRREIPINKFEVRDPHVVDRSAGLCTTLLPLLYELCVQSCKEKSTGRSPRDPQAIIDPYAEVESKIHAWNPTPPDNFLDRYLPFEVVAMLTQARTYRLAALLVIHRLRHPFGDKDEIGAIYADLILKDLVQGLALLKDGAKLHCTTFPLLMAVVELPSRGKEILDRYAILNKMATYSEKFVAFVRYIRQAREEGFKGVWFDLVSQGPELCMLP